MEKNEDLDKRAQGFNDKLIPLLQEFKLGLSAKAFITDDGRISAIPQLVDAPERKPQEKSPEIIEEA